MKIFCIPLLIAVTFALNTSCEKDDPAPAQYLSNSNIEGSTEQPWFFNGDTSIFTAECITDESFSPTHSLKIYTAISDPMSFCFWYQSISENLPIGKELTLTARIKADNLNGLGAALAIRADSDLGMNQFVTTQGTTTISGTFDWTEYSVNLPELSTEVTDILVFLVLLNNTTGTVYFDNIELKQVDIE